MSLAVNGDEWYDVYMSRDGGASHRTIGVAQTRMLGFEDGREA